VLVDPQLLATVYEALARRWTHSRTRGRKGTSNSSIDAQAPASITTAAQASPIRAAALSTAGTGPGSAALPECSSRHPPVNTTQRANSA
jgi:hypothetical protein